MEQIAAVKAANEDRAQGSERSSMQVDIVKKANKEYYAARPTKYQQQERERREDWAKFKRSQRTALDCLNEDGLSLYLNYEFRGASSAFKDAVKLIPSPQHYVHHQLLSYFDALSGLGLCLYELKYLQDTMVSCREALNCAAIQKQQKLEWTGTTYLSQNAISLESISEMKVCM